MTKTSFEDACQKFSDLRLNVSKLFKPVRHDHETAQNLTRFRADLQNPFI
jgi:hypothetical protein